MTVAIRVLQLSIFVHDVQAFGNSYTHIAANRYVHLFVGLCVYIYIDVYMHLHPHTCVHVCMTM